MAYAVEFLIARLKEQIELAPALQQNDEPGGECARMLERMREGVSLANHVPALKGVAGGPRRYRVALEAAAAKIEPLLAIWEAIERTPPENRAARFKDAPQKIVAACRGAIEDLKVALAVIEAGEAQQTAK
jgi:hypothetical protein